MENNFINILCLSINELLKFPESKKRAGELNSMYYFTNKKCRNGHLALKYSSSGNCLQCIYEQRERCLDNVRGKKTIRNEADQKKAIKALDRGETTYKSSVSCKSCKKNIRYASTNNCVSCSEESNKKRRWQRIKKIYGITEKEFINFLICQKHQCKICKTKLSKKNTHIDHCHTNGHVRGLLCSKCNQAIGLFNENAEIMHSAVKYLEQSK